MAVEHDILAILGPTASGKTEVALAVAKAIGAEILSVDSMQVYRAMDVGTAKPSVAQRTAVRHHLIDVADASETFTAARFVEGADAVIADAKRRGVPLVATGGTPLYFKTLFEGLFEGPGADASIRSRLRQLSGEELRRQLAEVDAPAAARIHANDTRRLVRALEVHELTGRPISSFQTDWEAANVRHQATWVGLSWPQEALNRRINARVKAMLAAGWLEEVRLLLAAGGFSPTASEATGYRALIAHLEGKLSLEEAVEQIKISTRQLARRQMKWFRRFPRVTWLPGEQPAAVLAQQIMSLWQGPTAV